MKMNPILITLITVLMVVLCMPVDNALAHPGHDHVMTKDEAIVRGKALLSSLVKKETPIAGKLLDESWADGSNPIACHYTPEYFLIAVKNKTTGNTVFLLLTSAGKFLRAKFDRNFSDLMFSSYPVLDC